MSGGVVAIVRKSGEPFHAKPGYPNFGGFVDVLPADMAGPDGSKVPGVAVFNSARRGPALVMDIETAYRLADQLDAVLAAHEAKAGAA